MKEGQSGFEIRKVLIYNILSKIYPLNVFAIGEAYSHSIVAGGFELMS